MLIILSSIIILYHYHGLYVQNDTLLLSHAFEIFCSKWIEIYELDAPHFLSPPGLGWQ